MVTLTLAVTGLTLSCVSLFLAYLARTRTATLRENLTTALTDNATLRRLLDREATRHVEELADLRAERDTAYAELKAKPLPGRETDGRFKKDPR